MKNKKIIIFLIILTVIPSFIFAQNRKRQNGSESWIMLGFEYGLFWENSSAADGTKVNSFMQSPGINLTEYSFFNKSNFGLYVNGSFLFPTEITTERNGVKTTVKTDSYDLLMQIGICVGLGFKFEITDQFILKGGIGPSYLQTVGLMKNYSLIGYNLGIGGEIGLKYNITDMFFVDVGTKFGFDFAAYTRVTYYSVTSSGWANDYFQFHLQPTVSLGINF